MFCGNCGNQISDDAMFCPNCGTRTAMVNEQQMFYNEAFVNSEEGNMGINNAFMVGTNMDYANGNQSVDKDKNYIYRIIGIAASVLAFISLFLNWMGRDDGIGKIKKYSFWTVMTEENGKFFIVIMILSIIFVIIFQILNRPRISMIGCVVMTIVMVIFAVVVGAANSNIWGIKYTFTGGMGIFVVALIGMYIAGCVPKKK